MTTATAGPAVAPTATPPPRSRRSGPGLRGETRAAYGFLAPALLLLVLFVAVPLAWAAVISLQRTNGFGAGTFIGLGNYARLLSDPTFWRSALNTLLFTALVTPLSMALGLGAALLLNSVLPARGLLRSVLILPMAVSGVATALIGLLVFDQNTGVVDSALRAVGLPSISWQSGSAPAFASVVLVTLWWRMGFNMLIYLAGLQGISPELTEAATLDGCTTWQRIRYVTIPLLGPSSFFLLIMNVIYSFQVFDIVYVLTGGGPQNATSVLVTYAYDTGFDTRDQGYAAAIGIVLLLLSLLFTAVQWRTNRSRDLVD
ncbi:carbohydrate ABC transporter permease [Lapillicoccus jejuensis]|uniref:Carbohydrate ABC transporter membrane protein 1 (CUT1 family) n=1 Tax=Lapillicoccus jejuensis TaxID=402171 RepID=A0A542DZU6_9MICO|nr:sugar ABC transporter permease [Lapillicoccus jejuensis]TQJ08631.1 carbohydrate ABC transporter membrane protein 1 (CUT1 family) [Lapillicoccus jejuensis]